MACDAVEFMRALANGYSKVITGDDLLSWQMGIFGVLADNSLRRCRCAGWRCLAAMQLEAICSRNLNNKSLMAAPGRTGRRTKVLQLQWRRSARKSDARRHWHLMRTA